MYNLKLAKLIATLFTQNGRPSRKMWNIIIFFYFLFVAGFLYYLSIQIVSYYSLIETEYIFIELDEHSLITATQIFNIEPNKSSTKFFQSLHSGDVIRIQTSCISGEIIEIYKSNQLVYKASGPELSACIAMAILTISVGVFFLVIVNTKKAGKRLRKIQRKLIG